MRVSYGFLFFFSPIIILKRAIVYQSLSLVFCFPLKAGPTLSAGSLCLAFGQGSLHRGMDALCVSESSPSALQGWIVEDFGGTNQQILKLWWPFGWSGTLCSFQADLSLAPHASCLSSPATGEWFQHSDPGSLGQGSDCSEKLDFFQIRPLASMVHALPQPGELAVTVDGYPWAC